MVAGMGCQTLAFMRRHFRFLLFLIRNHANAL